MAQAGLPKLNLASKSISIKSSASSSLSTAQRSGVSYGIRAQRSNTSIFNPKMAYSASTSELRHQLNSRVIINNNIPVRAQKQDNGMGTMEKLMMISMMGSMATQLGKGIADTIKELKGSKTDTSNNNNDNVEGKGATGSLNDLSKENTKIGKEVTNFNTGYKTLADGNIKKLNEIANKDEYKNSENQFIKSNLAKLSNTEALKTQDLGVSSDTSIPDLKTAAGTIDKDIQEVETYINSLPKAAEIDAADVALTRNLGEIEAQINSLDKNRPDYNTQKAKLEEQKQKLENQKKELADFKKDVVNANSYANSILKDVKTQKEDFTKLIQKKEECADKMYKQAQADDKAIGENNKKMDALEVKIKAEKDDTKKQKLIAQYNKMASLNKVLADSLNAAGEIKSAAGTTFSATYLAGAKVNPYPTDGTTGGAVNDQGSSYIINNSAGTPRNTSTGTDMSLTDTHTRDFIPTTRFNVNNPGDAFLHNMNPNNYRGLNPKIFFGE